MKVLLILLTVAIFGGAVAIAILGYQAWGALAILPCTMAYMVFATGLLIAWDDSAGRELAKDMKAILQEWSNSQAQYL